ncbi:type I secretion system permease/ATPase [Rhodobacteraceae bacterium D3-12]|nr:type I secretion system permease/ATPase [Rhodobacteraceae bacterium D3-12]
MRGSETHAKAALPANSGERVISATPIKADASGGGGKDGDKTIFHKRLGPVDFSGSLKMGTRAVRRNLLLVMLFTCATNLLILAIPIYLFQISDRVFTSRSMDTLIMLTTVIVGAVILQAILDAVRRFVLMRTAVELAVQLGSPILSAAARASLNGNGREYQTLGDLQQLRSFLVSGTLLSFLDVPFAPLFILAIYLVHPHLGTIVIVTALILFVIALINQRMTSGRFAQANVHQSRANLHLDSMSRNSQIINALAMIPEAVSIWGKDTAASLKAQVAAQDRNIISAAFSRAVRLLTQIGLLGWGAYLAIDGQITGGMVIAASIIAGRALAPVEGAIEGWNQFLLSRAAYDRIAALLRASPLNTQRLLLPNPEGRLDVERLLFVPQGTKRVVLNGLSFILAPGESLAVIGNSGAGKTTLGKMLVGSLLPTSGSVRLDLMDLRNWDQRQLGQNIGYLPQDVQLFPGTIKDNIARMRTDATDEQIHEAAVLADVHDMIANLPEGYETVVRADGSPLSGGKSNASP